MTTALRPAPAPIGLLLVNLGTPQAPTPRAVRRYLRQFLSDPRVLDLPALPRWLLVHLIIAPFRARRSAAAYRSIWTKRGSPLLVHTRTLAERVASLAPDHVHVELAMRYGEPSVEAAVARLAARGIGGLKVLPLYPQWAASTSGSAAAAAMAAASRFFDPVRVEVLPPFPTAVGFVDALVRRARSALDATGASALVCSYHGLPERQIRKSRRGPGSCRLSDTCCTPLSARNAHCYRAQCLATTDAVARSLDRPDVVVRHGFQSRLGRARWLGPSTWETLRDLLASGHRRVAVCCPSFVADCLETLEEIGIRTKQAFLAAGGESLELVPAPQDDPAFARTLCEIAGVVPSSP